MNEPLAAHLAVRLTRATADSARPDAPVVPDRAPRRSDRSGSGRSGLAGAARLRLAADLRTVARWVEPRTRQPGTRPTGACQNG